MSVLLQDLRFALRQMAKRPGFTAVVILTMALGIGANAAIFSVLDAILLRPLPFSQPEGLVKIWSRFTGIGIPNDQNWVSAPEFRDYQQLNRSFTDLAAISSVRLISASREARSVLSAPRFPPTSLACSAFSLLSVGISSPKKLSQARTRCHPQLRPLASRLWRKPGRDRKHDRHRRRAHVGRRSDALRIRLPG